MYSNSVPLEPDVPLKHILFEDFHFVLQLKLPAKVLLFSLSTGRLVILSLIVYAKTTFI